MQHDKIGAPYVLYNVTKAAAVASLQRWSNLKVKVVGVLCETDDAKKRAALMGSWETAQPCLDNGE